MRSTAYSYRSTRLKLIVHTELTRRFSALYRRRMCVNFAQFVKLVVFTHFRKYAKYATSTPPEIDVRKLSQCLTT